MSELQVLQQKIALSNKLRYYLTTTSPPYTVLHQTLDVLRRQYPDSFNDIEQLRQNIHNYGMRPERLEPDTWIVNWNNIRLLIDMNRIF